jgi:hypothetical protein
VFGITIAIWLFDAALFWTILAVFDLPLHPGWALLAMTVTNIGILVPSAPGHIGPFHYFAMQALISVGVAEPTAAGYALVVHLAIFVPLTLWGAGLLWRQGLQVGATIAAVREARKVGGVPADGPGTIIAGSTYREAPPVTTPFMRSLAEAVIPMKGEPRDPETRRQAVDRAAEFLTGQIRELPPRLRGAFRAGCWGFRLLVSLRHGRGFISLPLARRQALVEAWAYGRVPPARQLFRPVRSLVLLAWYDPPAVESYVQERSAS